MGKWRTKVQMSIEKKNTLPTRKCVYGAMNLDEGGY